MSNWKKWVWPTLVSGCLVGLVTVGLSQSPPEKDGGDKPGRYQAVSAGTTVILLDTATGKTWRTQGSFGGFPGAGEEVWVPMTKFDTMEAYSKWREERDRKMFADKGIFPPFKEKGPPFFDKDGPPFKEKLPPFKDKLPPFKDKGPPLFKDKAPVLDKDQPPFDKKD